MFIFVDFSVEIQQVDGDRKGKVAIYHNGKRGLVCSSGWDTHDATVVCQEKSLGINGNAVQFSNDKNEIVLLSGVNCIGNETRLSRCLHNGIGTVENCTFIAGVECSGEILVARLFMYLVLI